MLQGNNPSIPAFNGTHSHSYLKSAAGILLSYNGSIPFHDYLRKYFSQNKKHGSKDRRSISALCYSYFRLGHAVIELPVDERILIGLFLCSHESNGILKALRPAWNEKITSTLEEKYTVLRNLAPVAGDNSLVRANIELPYQFSINDVFPFRNELSKGADHRKFCESFLVQPDLFLRLRPGKEKSVKQKLKSAGIAYKIISGSCISLANASQVSTSIKPDKEAVVQDYNSQMVGKILQPVLEMKSGKNKINRQQQISVWDCCAASGGKSILVYDINPSIHLTVSDKRNDIIQTLKQRFERAGIKGYHAFVADLTKKDDSNARRKDNRDVSKQAIPLYDLIIADVPCTGSGTWARTPEQLCYFNTKDIERYSSLQKQIVNNIIPHLKPGGHLVYVTCSVFRNENEEIVDYIKQNSSLTLNHMELLKGYTRRADTMFAALLTN